MAILLRLFLFFEDTKHQKNDFIFFILIEYQTIQVQVIDALCQ